MRRHSKYFIYIYIYEQYEQLVGWNLRSICLCCGAIGSLGRTRADKQLKSRRGQVGHRQCGHDGGIVKGGGCGNGSLKTYEDQDEREHLMYV